jgi:putative DNA primase/helicase
MSDPARGSGHGRSADPERWHEVSRKQPCPVCHKTSWCRVSADGQTVACRRESQSGEERHYSDGSLYYLHRLQGAFEAPKRTRKPQSPQPVEIPPAGVETLHAVYQALLDRLTLSEPHRLALGTRGLSPEQIERRGYRSLPARRRALFLGRLVERFGAETLVGVPGFFRDARGDLSLSSLPGLLVPVRNHESKIAALKVRPDKPLKDSKYLYLSSKSHNGPGPGAPAHVPLGVSYPVRLVRLTEGELKADVATTLSGLPTISVAGVASWRSALSLLRELGVETVRLAFDADAEVNENVARSLWDCAGTLELHGFTLELERWDASKGKGIDDVLLSDPSAIQVLTGETVMTEIRRLAQAAGVKEPLELEPARAPREDLKPNEAPEDPHRLARFFRDQACRHPDGDTLRYWRDEWRRWEESAYRPLTEREFRAQLTAFIKVELDRVNVEALRAFQNTNNGRRRLPQAHPVTTQLVTNTLQALTGYTVLKSRTDPPAWLETDARFPADEILPARNALVHLPSLVAGKTCTVPPTPAFFSLWSLDYDFDPDAPAPTEWLRFLHELWPNDDPSIETLQEWFGYHLIPDTRHQKILMLVGPRRSGKGTIARVLSSVIGSENIAAPTLSGLATNFGLAPLIGKQAAVISDARLSGQADSAVIVERLLSISGEDTITIDRKHQSAWTGKLGVRFTLLSNELPRLKDASGAFPSRLILLCLTRSFLGQEDEELFDRLHAERPGILLWAIEGWRRLRERRRFVQPESGRQLIEEMENLGSPVLAFLRDRCRIGPECEVPTKALYEAWCAWCALKGKKHPGDEQNFGRELHAAIPGLKTCRTRRAGEQLRLYQGIEVVAEAPQPF